MSIAELAIVAVGVYVVVLWVSLAFYVVRDARQRSRSIGFQLFAIIFGFVPPFLGPLVYLVARPPRTLDEERTVQLEEAALTNPFSDGPTARPCPSCGREIESDFVVCPYCKTQFARRCDNCGKALRLGWGVCPYCAKEVGAHPVPRVAATGIGAAPP